MYTLGAYSYNYYYVYKGEAIHDIAQHGQQHINTSNIESYLIIDYLSLSTEPINLNENRRS